MVIAIGAALLLLLMLLVSQAFDVDDGAGIFNLQSVAAFLTGFGAIAWLLSGYFDVSSLLAASGGILAITDEALKRTVRVGLIDLIDLVHSGDTSAITRPPTDNTD